MAKLANYTIRIGLPNVTETVGVEYFHITHGGILMLYETDMVNVTRAIKNWLWVEVVNGPTE